MADEKKIQVGIGGGEEVINYMNRLKKEAASYFDTMVRASRNYTTSGKEVSADLDAQIKKFEKLKSIEIERRASERKLFYESRGELSKGVESTIHERAAKEKEELKLQASLLRELIDTVKDTAKQEIRENRHGVEEQIKTSKTVGRLAPRGDSETILKETLQREMLGGIKEDEQKEEAWFNRAGQKSNQAMVAVAGAKNEFALLAGALAAIPVVGQGVAALAGRALSATEGYQKSYSSAYGVTGMGWQGFGAGNGALGITMEGAIGEGSSLSRQRGGAYARRNAINSLMMQRGMGLSQSDVYGVERTLRGSNTAGIDVVTGMTAGLEKTGAISKGDYSLVPEYLRILAQTSQEQLNTLGKVDVGVNEKMVLGLSQLDESFKNPDVLQGVLNSIRGGLTNAATPQAEALQYSVLSKMNPNASWFDIQKMREQPSPEYLKSVLGELQRMSGGVNDEYFTNIMGMFNTSASIAEKIGMGDLEAFDQLLPSGKGIKKQLPGRTAGATSTIEEANAKFQNTFAEAGDMLVTKIDGYIKELQTWLSENKETNEKALTFIEALMKYGTPAGLSVVIADKVTKGALTNTLDALKDWVSDKID